MLGYCCRDCFQHKMCWEQNTHIGLELVLPSERRQPSWPPPSAAVGGESRAWCGKAGVLGCVSLCFHFVGGISGHGSFLQIERYLKSHRIQRC